MILIMCGFVIFNMLYAASDLPIRSHVYFQCKKISNDQEPIQSDPTSCPQNQKGNN